MLWLTLGRDYIPGLPAGSCPAGGGGTGAPRVQCPSGTWAAQKQPGFTSSAQALLSDPLGGTTSATGKILPILKFLIEEGEEGWGGWVDRLSFQWYYFIKQIKVTSMIKCNPNPL